MLSVSSFVVLCLLFLQVVIARTLETGTYLIVDNQGYYLGLGPVNPIYPPPDVPARLFASGTHAVHWHVKQVNGGAVTISLGQGLPNDYKLVAKGDSVFASAQKTPQVWSVTSAGDFKYVIQLEYQDEVFTAHPLSEREVTLERAKGKPNQQWSFIRIDREVNYHRGSTNRFCKQEAW
ncbi:hypothetical protein MVEG_11973 [Podila verticillata NRRL 6337]|uniref:Ricin B lectin domain-containing protein n=1 Tax=Podila verticillata NRRL 6337 TaxID=1069443 RepID=A0A086TKV3_9FUNG|nr:hypothetical protein MVEG_11973 [Podila verticillata NRRL 6337]